MITDNDKEQLDELVYVLQGRTKPTLVFISVGSYQKRAELISEVERPLHEYRFYTLDLTGQKVFSLYKALHEQVPPAVLNSQKVEYMVHVLGLEDSLYVSPSGGVNVSSLVGELNFERENLFQEFPFCILIWTTPYFTTQIKKNAQDLWDWITYSYTFPDSESAAITKPTEDKASTLPRGVSKERQERIQELETRYRSIDLGGSEPERVIKEKLTLQKLLAKEYEEAFLLQKSIDAYHAALSLNRQMTEKDHFTECLLHYLLGWVYWKNGQMKMAIESFRQSLTIQEELGDTVNVVGMYQGIGRAYLRLHNWQESLQNYQLGLEWCEKTGNKSWKGALFHEIGIVFAEQRRWEEAMENYRLALEVKDETGDYFEMGDTYHQIGMIFDEQRRWDEALENYRLALDWYERSGNTFVIGGTYHQIGMVFQEQRRWDEALENYRLALEWHERTGNRFNVGITYHQIGRVLEKQRCWEEALENYRLALKWNEATGNSFEMGVTYHQIARVFEEQQLWEEALKNFLTAFSLFYRFHDPRIDSCSQSIKRVIPKLEENRREAIIDAVCADLATNEKEDLVKQIL